MLAIISQIKRLVKKTDFFFSTEMLRVDDEQQYKTLTGGIVSLGIIVTIVIGFASMILDTLDRNTFTITIENIKNLVPTPSNLQINNQSPFRLAIEVWRHNLTAQKRYFDIIFTLDYQNYGVSNKITNITLEPCTKQFFKDYPEITDNFQTLQSSGWLCPSLNTTIQLQGKYSSSNFNEYIIQASVCKNETDPSRPCASPQQIEQLFEENNNLFYFSLYFTNTQINPDKKDYKRYHIEDRSYALFGKNMGSEVFLQFTDYTVNTDYSIWPFSNVISDTGFYAQNIGTIRGFQKTMNENYVLWSIIKAPNSIIYQRQVQKVSMVFSFMGGMIGAVSAVLFIIKIYTNVAFQFSIALQIFKPKQIQEQNFQKTQATINGRAIQKIKSQNQLSKKKKKPELFSMNFFTFIKFYIFNLLDHFKIQYDAPDIKYAQQCKEEILKQLDIKKLLKRIIFIQHCLTKIFDDYHLDILQLKKPETPEEIREIRLKCESIVDQQLTQQSNLQSFKESANQLKQSEAINSNFPDAPYAVISSNQQRSIHLSQNPTYFPVKRFQQSISVMKNQMIIENLDQIKEEIPKKPQTPLQKLHRLQKSKQIRERLRKNKKRDSHLMQLLATAQEGMEISNMIWKKLDQTTKKKAAHFSNRLEFS